MKLKSLALTLIAAAALAACSSWRSGPPAGGTPAARVDCAINNTEANTCVVRGPVGDRRMVCHLFVGLTTNGDPYVYPYTLRVPRGAVNITQRRIVWHSADRRFVRFETGQGPQGLPPGAGNFLDNAPTDDMDGEGPAATPAQRYRVRSDHPVGRHSYDIQFQQNIGTVLSPNWQPRSCDPIIINSDSG